MSMFSSNQQLAISGYKACLAEDIAFAIRKSGYDECFLRKERPVACGYQIAPGGLYLIGHLGIKGEKPEYGNDYEGWTEYPFDYDPEIIAGIVKQWLAKQEYPRDEYDGCDGSRDNGYLIRDVWMLDDGARHKIKHIHDAIICISPYKNFYAK